MQGSLLFLTIISLVGVLAHLDTDVDRVVPEYDTVTPMEPLQHIEKHTADGLTAHEEAKAAIMAQLLQEEAQADARADQEDSKEQETINAVLDKARHAEGQATALLGDDDAAVIDAKQRAQDIKKDAEKSAQHKLNDAKDQMKKQMAKAQSDIDAMKAEAQTQAKGKLAQATTKANDLMLQVQTQEVKSKSLIQTKAEEMKQETADTAAAEAKKAADAIAKEKQLEDKVNTRLAKAKKLEAAASKEKKDAQLAALKQQKVFEANKKYLEAEAKAAKDAFAKAQKLATDFTSE